MKKINLIETLGLKYTGEEILILDQTLLPQQELWVNVTEVSDMIKAIKELKVRGAPMIALAASVCLSHQSQKINKINVWLKTLDELIQSRPTAVNLQNSLERLKNKALSFGLSSIPEEVKKIFEEDRLQCDEMAHCGAKLIEKGDRILTYCNTGGLATAGVGTALGVIKLAHSLQYNISVVVPETRPLLQGARLTAWELNHFDIPHTLICDNMCGHLMATGALDKVFVGADRIVKNGDFANKVGTYSLAVLAHYHRIPFYVVAPKTTLDLETKTGRDIVIELRAGEEVKGFFQKKANILWSPEETSTYNPAFDITPANLVTGWIIDGDLRVESDFQKYEKSN